MEIKLRNYVPFMQEGGAIEEQPVEQAPEAPAEGGGEDPTQQLLMACQQALETQDCQLAMQVCQALMQMAGGGAPEAAPQGEPVYRRGGKLVKRITN